MDRMMKQTRRLPAFLRGAPNPHGLGGWRAEEAVDSDRPLTDAALEGLKINQRDQLNYLVATGIIELVYADSEDVIKGMEEMQLA